ncbi:MULTISPECIES: CPBP family intramembrane glutamic endopeptidase [unclassified Bacillus (in: firmicutes)]|uniref:CPBP family intramembrane glutamic endopeptidase n=1 Tax=unclassified Bacillus (in: firmicutes) TaxID=185979 RepID=UPI001BE7D443|nr:MULTISPECIES: CPBP family intramembrane glutamic endopeptidase [unclassified Bacillus (in: firmicutes)]MBT2638841.1 CPBP family intramembrane metalloprotease [Bacillus sp. ISL-39]MBT2660983.1 CPBP family intramembrane metalloprotease [Bacillus sp. ISL-45]
MKDQYKETVARLTEKELLFHLIATQILLLTISAILGMIMFDSFNEFQELFIWSDWNILFVGLTAGAAVVVMDFIFMKYLPKSYYDDGGLNERIFRKRSVVQIMLIAAMVAISEEILFRGVIQTNTGLIISSIIFAVVHYRYLFNWFLFTNIILLSFLIGYIYMVTNNLVVTIVMHFFIDFILGLIIKFRTQATIGGTGSE